jgi:hypothetical protein
VAAGTNGEGSRGHAPASERLRPYKRKALSDWLTESCAGCTRRRSIIEWAGWDRRSAGAPTSTKLGGGRLFAWPGEPGGLAAERPVCHTRAEP